MHSFGMSERYVVLAENPLIVNPMSMPLSKKAFIDNYTWEPERGTRLIVMDRHTGEVQGIHETDAMFCFHHVNSFERDGELVVDLIAYDDPAVIHMLDLDAAARRRAGADLAQRPAPLPDQARTARAWSTRTSRRRSRPSCRGSTTAATTRVTTAGCTRRATARATGSTSS